MQRDRVWFAEGGAPAWPEIQNPTRRQGRGHELAAVVQPGSPALDTALRKSDAIRKELANAATLDTQPGRRVKGYVSRGQGQNCRYSYCMSRHYLHPVTASIHTP